MKKILLVALIFILTPIAAFAQSNLVNLPIGDTNSFNDYINAVYAMFISIAAMIAVVKIIIAGVKYMFTDIVPQKTEAKKDIQAALLGLVVVLAAVLILTVINPDLTNFNLDVGQLDKRERVELNQNSYNAVTTERGTSIDLSNNSPNQIASYMNNCKEQRGGSIVAINNEMICELGQVVIINENEYDPILSKSDCETGSGYVWDDVARVCRSVNNLYEYQNLPIDPLDEDLDINDPADYGYLNEVCSRNGIRWQFAPEEKQCRKLRAKGTF